MSTQCTTIELPKHARRQVSACFDGGRLSNDGGALLLAAADRALRLTARLAGCFQDYRQRGRCEHSVQALSAQRLFGLALGYEDLNDHDTLRDDSLLALAVGCADVTGQSRVRQRDKGHPLAGSSTLNRFELGRPEQAAKDRYKRIVGDAQQLDRLLVQLFIEMQAAEPEELVLDIDASDDPLHGEQEGRYFHGYYDCYCYLPLYVTCGRHVLSGQLRTADVDPAVGALEDVQRIVAQLRERWPQVRPAVYTQVET